MAGYHQVLVGWDNANEAARVRGANRIGIGVVSFARAQEVPPKPTAEHKILAWMHGRMEFGARALGNRSILASPLDPYSTENLNAYIKHREGFRKLPKGKSRKRG